MIRLKTDMYRLIVRYGVLSTFFAVLGYGWLTTAVGLRATLNIVSYALPSSQLTLKGVKGSLWGPISIDDLSYFNKTSRLSTTQLAFNWKKSALLKGQIRISHLNIGTLNIESHGNNGKLPSLSPLMRFQIDHFSIKEAIIKNQQYTLVLKENSHDQNIRWWLTGNHFKWRGNIEYHPNKATFATLSAQPITIPSDQNQDASFEIALKRDKSNWYLQVKNPGNPVQAANFLNVTFKKANANYFLPKRSLLLDVDGVLKDWNILKFSPLKRLQSIFSEASGPMRLNGHLRISFKALMRCMDDPERWLYNVQSQRQSSVYAKAFITWKNPCFISWGSFQCLNVQATLKDSSILWQGSLAQSNKDKKLNRWQLKGDIRSTCIDKAKRKAHKGNIITSFQLSGDPLQLFSNTAYAFSLAPKIEISSFDRQVDVRGKMYIPTGQFTLQSPATEIALDNDIYFVQSNLRHKKTKWPLTVTLDTILGESVYLHYAGLKSRLNGALTLQKYNAEPMWAKGQINLVEGHYYHSGQFLQLDPHSRLIFSGPLYNPNLDVKASRLIDSKPSNQILQTLPFHLSESNKEAFLVDSTTDVKLPLYGRVGIHLYGKLDAPSMRLFCPPFGPIIDPVDRISYLVTGQPFHGLHESALALFLNTGGQFIKGYSNYHGALTDVDKRFEITTSVDAESRFRNTYLSLNKQLTSQLVLSGKLGLIKQDGGMDLNYKLNKNTVAHLSWRHADRLGLLDLLYQREWGN